MSTAPKVIVFGIISGLIWSVMPGVLGLLFSSSWESVLVLLAGMLTGIAVSSVLRVPLARCGRLQSLAVGLVALPFGAFVFGVFFTLLDILFGKLSTSQYITPFTPFTMGFVYAFFSVQSLYGLVLFPLAILTTFLLWLVVRSRKRHQDAA